MYVRVLGSWAGVWGVGERGEVNLREKGHSVLHVLFQPISEMTSHSRAFNQLHKLCAP